MSTPIVPLGSDTPGTRPLDQFNTYHYPSAAYRYNSNIYCPSDLIVYIALIIAYILSHNIYSLPAPRGGASLAVRGRWSDHTGMLSLVLLSEHTISLLHSSGTSCYRVSACAGRSAPSARCGFSGCHNALFSLFWSGFVPTSFSPSVFDNPKLLFFLAYGLILFPCGFLCFRSCLAGLCFLRPQVSSIFPDTSLDATTRSRRSPNYLPLAARGWSHPPSQW